MHKIFYYFHWFKKKNRIFSFSTVKMAAKYAKSDRVGGLDAGLNKFHLFKISEIFTILLWNINNLK